MKFDAILPKWIKARELRSRLDSSSGERARSAFEDWQYAADTEKGGANPGLGNAQEDLLTHLRENVHCAANQEDM